MHVPGGLDEKTAIYRNPSTLFFPKDPCNYDDYYYNYFSVGNRTRNNHHDTAHIGIPDFVLLFPTAINIAVRQSSTGEWNSYRQVVPTEAVRH